MLAMVFPGFFALASCKILSGAVLTAIAFADSGKFIRTAAVFFAVSSAFAGAVYGALSLAGVNPGGAAVLPVSMRTLILSFSLCYAVLSLVFRGSARRAAADFGDVEVSLRGKKASFRALRDTGNELRDSKGFPVVAAEWAAVAPLFPELSQSQNPDPPSLLLSIDVLDGMKGRASLLPCLTVTSPSGLLPCIRPDALTINGKKTPHRLLAIIPGPICRDGSYRALY